jgi:hypothetical protein
MGALGPIFKHFPSNLLETAREATRNIRRSVNDQVSKRVLPDQLTRPVLKGSGGGILLHI